MKNYFRRMFKSLFILFVLLSFGCSAPKIIIVYYDTIIHDKNHLLLKYNNRKINQSLNSADSIILSNSIIKINNKNYKCVSYEILRFDVIEDPIFSEIYRPVIRAVFVRQEKSKEKD